MSEERSHGESGGEAPLTLEPATVEFEAPPESAETPEDPKIPPMALVNANPAPAEGDQDAKAPSSEPNSEKEETHENEANSEKDEENKSESNPDKDDAHENEANSEKEEEHKNKSSSEKEEAHESSSSSSSDSSEDQQMPVKPPDDSDSARAPRNAPPESDSWNVPETDLAPVPPPDDSDAERAPRRALLETDSEDVLEPQLPPVTMKAVEPRTSRVPRPIPLLPRIRPRPPGTRNAARTVSYRQSTPVRPEVTAQQRALMAKAIKGESLAGLDQPVYEELIFNLGQDRKEKAMEHKYKEGQRINEAIKNVDEYLTKLKKKQAQKEALEEFNQQKRAFEEERDKFDEETKRLMQELRETLDRQRKELIQEHEQQLKEHDERWSAPAKLRQYNRASNVLTELRRKHAFLLVQSRFEEAEAVNAIIQERTRAEEAGNHAAHQNAYEESLMYLTDKQRSELEFFDVSAATQMTKLEQKRARLRWAWENKGKKLDARGEIVNDADRLWNLKQMERLENLSTTMTSRSATTNVLPSSKMTRKDLRDSDVVILTLPPLDLKSKRARKAKRIK